MVIKNVDQRSKLTKYHRFLLDSYYTSAGLTYLDCLKVLSKRLDRTLLSYDDIKDVEFEICKNALNHEFEFEWRDGIRRVILDK